MTFTQSRGSSARYWFPLINFLSINLSPYNPIKNAVVNLFICTIKKITRKKFLSKHSKAFYDRLGKKKIFFIATAWKSFKWFILEFFIRLGEIRYTKVNCKSIIQSLFHVNHEFFISFSFCLGFVISHFFSVSISEH